MTRLSTIAVLTLLAACDPVTLAETTVRVSPGVQALYDADNPALVHVEIDAGTLLEYATLATLCEPTDGELVLEETFGGIGCAAPGTITAWVQPVEAGTTDCGVLEDDAPSVQVERNADHVQDAQLVFQAVDGDRCVGETDEVSLFLAL